MVCDDGTTEEVSGTSQAGLEVGRLLTSVGTLRYSENPYKLIVEVDPEIVRYYRALLPKYIHTNPQAYAPHISVVRNEVPVHLEHWGKYEGQPLEFTYEGYVYSGQVYIWLNAFSTRLEEIRTELGLPVSTEYTRPPDTFIKVFHITLGNRKGLANV